MRITKSFVMHFLLFGSMLAMVLIPGGFIFAAEQPLLPGQTIEVNGTMDSVLYIPPETWYIDEDLNLVGPGVFQIWTLHGDLEGTYFKFCDYIIPFEVWILGGGPFYYEGYATFTGYVLGKKTDWTADLEGAGDHPNFNVFEGTEEYFSTITSATRSLSHMRGDITMTGAFPEGQYTYSGELYFEIHKNK